MIYRTERKMELKKLIKEVTAKVIAQSLDDYHNDLNMVIPAGIYTTSSEIWPK
jgi:hypothetical protein